MHPQKEMEVDLCWAYNRWVTEKVLPELGGRMYSMLCLPFSDPAACIRQVETFGGCPGVTGFMVTTVRHLQVNDNAYMRAEQLPAGARALTRVRFRTELERTGVPGPNRFLSVHALGFTFFNILHLTNWVINGMGERFPKLPVIWIELGLAWVPFLMQRRDDEYMMRPSEAPLLKKKPSEYMRDMYYSSQPMEIEDRQALECTFRMINADTELLYSSDYPHWDFDLPSTSTTCPSCRKRRTQHFGGTAARPSNLPPRNDQQKENLKKFGNLAA